MLRSQAPPPCGTDPFCSKGVTEWMVDVQEWHMMEPMGKHTHPPTLVQIAPMSLQVS